MLRTPVPRTMRSSIRAIVFLPSGVPRSEAERACSHCWAKDQSVIRVVQTVRKLQLGLLSLVRASSARSPRRGPRSAGTCAFSSGRTRASPGRSSCRSIRSTPLVKSISDHRSACNSPFRAPLSAPAQRMRQSGAKPLCSSVQCEHGTRFRGSPRGEDLGHLVRLWAAPLPGAQRSVVRDRLGPRASAPNSESHGEARASCPLRAQPAFAVVIPFESLGVSPCRRTAPSSLDNMCFSTAFRYVSYVRATSRGLHRLEPFSKPLAHRLLTRGDKFAPIRCREQVPQVFRRVFPAPAERQPLLLATPTGLRSEVEDDAPAGPGLASLRLSLIQPFTGASPFLRFVRMPSHHQVRRPSGQTLQAAR